MTESAPGGDARRRRTAVPEVQMNRSSIPGFERIAGTSDPYPWQRCLYARFREGCVPPELYLPTGTGKTSVALLYLLALAQGARLPTRLVYIVDRRAIVDQTAERVEAWVDRLAGIPEAARAIDARAAFPLVAGHRIVPIGVVRGGVRMTRTPQCSTRSRCT